MKRINLLFILVLIANLANATIYLVQPNSSGAVWTSPAGTVVDLAVEAKSLNAWYATKVFTASDEIWLIKGTYTLTDSITTQATEKIRGGFAGTELTIGDRKKGVNGWDFTNETIIDGNSTVRGISSKTGATIEGLSIQNCYFAGGSAINGAAARIAGASVMQYCIVRNNSIAGTSVGGGVFVATGGRVQSCYVHHNSTTGTAVSGGGIFVSIIGTIDGCTITNNTATGSGGGLHIDKAGGAVISNCILMSNSAAVNGGGIGASSGNYTFSTTLTALSITSCTISLNTASAIGGGGYIDLPNASGYGNYIVAITNSIISSNTGTTNGGGLGLLRGKYTISGCAINSNSLTSNSGSGGGGIYIPYSMNSTLNINNTVVKSNNISTRSGSAIFLGVLTSTFTNCVITRNIGASFISHNNSYPITFQNCTMGDNLNASSAEAGIYLGTSLINNAASTATNCIFFNCTTNPFSAGAYGTKYPIVTYCAFSLAAVPTVCADKTGCITSLTSAAFADATNGNWSLSSSSPAKDTGTSTSMPTADIMGVARPQGGAYDMGAFEYTTDATPVTISKDVSVSNLALTPNSALTVSSGAHLTVDAISTLKNITAQPGSKVTLNTGKTLTVDDISLNSNATGTATFVDQNTNGGLTVNNSANVQQYLTGHNGTSGRAYWYLGSPVLGATSGVFSIADGVNKMTWYDETIPGYMSQLTDNSTSLQKGRGYVVYIGGNDAAYTFSTNSGIATTKLNSGVITLNPTRTGLTAGKRGFNLIANPYPSFLDWNAVTKTDVKSTIWYRTFTGSGMQFDTFDGTYGTGVGLNGTVNQYIPPIQAFWVKVTADGLTGSLTFNNSMRSHQEQALATNRLRTPSSEKSMLVRLKVSNGVATDEALIVADDEATDGFDSFDSPKMTNGNASIPEIYTLADSEELVINHINSMNTNKELPLGFRTGTENNYTISATEAVNLDANLRIILKDKLLNIERDLTNGAVYSFKSGATDVTSRFSIQFKSASIISKIDDTSESLSASVHVNANRQLVVCNQSNLRCNLIVCNSIGQEVVRILVSDPVKVIDRVLTPGVYVVTLGVNAMKTARKIVIN